MAFLKYDMKCSNEECGKSIIVVVDAEETATPNICPFCGGESAEEPGDATVE